MQRFTPTPPVDTATSVDTVSIAKSSLLLKRYAAIAVGVFVLLLLVNTGVKWLQPHEFQGTVLQATTPVVDFRLETTAGKAMQLSDFRGKYVLLYFGYTYCPDACPLTLNDLSDMMNRLGAATTNVQVILVSLDPERDTVAQLAAYLPHFHPDFLGMTGGKEEILKVATQFGIFYEKRGDSIGYTIDHTSTVIVVDPEGYLKLVFPYGTTGEQMASDLRYLLR
jgi:protein SCO1